LELKLGTKPKLMIAQQHAQNLSNSN